MLFMKLSLNVNLILTLIQIKLQFSFGLFVCLFQFSFFSLLIWQTSHFDFLIWIQRQRIDTKNSFKLSSETCWIDANVLEETTSTTSCILSCFFISNTHQFNNLIFSLIEMLIGFWNNLCNFGTIENLFWILAFISAFYLSKFCNIKHKWKNK
jgi:hypothetical protein